MPENPVPADAEPLPRAAVAQLVAELLRDGRRVSLAVGGVSMAPLMRAGDRVVLEPVDRVGRGDVVARLAGDRLLIHRVVAVVAGTPLTRGDSATEPDPPLGDAELLGRVCRVERSGRAVGFGLGPERVPLALLSRRGWLRPLLAALRRVWRGSA